MTREYECFRSTLGKQLSLGLPRFSLDLLGLIAAYGLGIAPNAVPTIIFTKRFTQPRTAARPLIGQNGEIWSWKKNTLVVHAANGKKTMTISRGPYHSPTIANAISSRSMMQQCRFDVSTNELIVFGAHVGAVSVLNLPFRSFERLQPRHISQYANVVCIDTAQDGFYLLLDSRLPDGYSLQFLSRDETKPARELKRWTCKEDNTYHPTCIAVSREFVFVRLVNWRRKCCGSGTYLSKVQVRSCSVFAVLNQRRFGVGAGQTGAAFARVGFAFV